MTDLEHLVDRELRRLPLPQAPLTLLPRVMAAVHEWAARPWYTRAWLTWPAGWQIASSLAMVLVVAATATLLSTSQASAAAAAVATLLGDLAAPMSPIARYLALAEDVARIATNAVRPFALYAFPFVMLMGLACAVFGTALNQVVFGKAFPR